MDNDNLQQLFYENPISLETFKSQFRLIDPPVVTDELMEALAKANDMDVPKITIDSILIDIERA